MTEHRLEVADVFQLHGQEFLDRWGHTLSAQQRKALQDISACRTASLGQFVQQCDHCSHQVIEFKSCRNRHCPKCHRRARDQWLANRAQELLPVTYSHVVFTLPHELAPVALQNPQVVYGILFRAVAEALLEMAADPKRLGAKRGFLAVLHTWSQRLQPHPHVHCVVPAGGISPDGKRWISPRKQNFFLPVKPLGRLFRRKFLTYLQAAFGAGQLSFYGALRDLAHPARFEHWAESLKQKEWVAHVKPPFGGPEQVLRYLARYTHRVAISNGRLLGLEESRVRFRWRDSKDLNQIKEMSLDAVEFIRRFLQHVLPSGFVKIRHFGFLSNRNRRPMVERCRELLPPWTPTPKMIEPYQAICPACGIGHLHVVESRPPVRSTTAASHQPPRVDSS
ncbi:MAG: IS91 family transposase [Acidobacteriota bacterium]|nr:IS91 family transposase [Acidobacteriota bacterium]